MNINIVERGVNPLFARLRSTDGYTRAGCRHPSGHSECDLYHTKIPFFGTIL